MLTRRDALRLGLGLPVLAAIESVQGQDSTPWPPVLQGARDGTVSLRTDAFLTIPDSVRSTMGQDGYAPFTVATTPPTVELAYHGNLGENAVGRRLWSSWGDIGLASDGRVYCAIGDHANDVGGDARCFLYRWDPAHRKLEQVVDMNVVVPPQAGQPAWSKVHAKIDEGPDGKIYFSCTLNDGNRAVTPNYRWTDRLPGGQLYRFDPQTNRTTVFADLPRPRCTATSMLDRARNIWWCNLEGGGNAMWGLHLGTKEVVFRGEDGTVSFNRNFAMGRDGTIYFNGQGGIWKIDPTRRTQQATRSSFEGSPGMRSSTRESRDGAIYGTTYRQGQLFRYCPAQDEIRLLGPDWLRGDYSTVCELSPDERFVYYLPGAHGQAYRSGTPVLQYEIGTGRRKVLAFLAPAFEQTHNYVPAGTYGMKVSADGSTLFVNFNGHPADSNRPRAMRPNGFGLTAFAAIHIPASER